MLMTILMSSCSINRFIPEGKSLVQSNKIVIESKKKTEISKSGLSNYITLKPDLEMVEREIRQRTHLL